jgi:hypothetical protein
MRCAYTFRSATKNRQQNLRGNTIARRTDDAIASPLAAPYFERQRLCWRVL